MLLPSRRSLLAGLGLLSLAVPAPAAALGLQPPAVPATALAEPVRGLRVPRLRVPRFRNPVTRFRHRQRPTRF